MGVVVKILVLVYVVGMVPAMWVTRRRWWGVADPGRGLMLWAGTWPLWVGPWMVEQWFGTDDNPDDHDGDDVPRR